MIIVRMFFSYANAIVLSIFSASIATTMALCSYFKVPFYKQSDLGNSIAHIKQNILPTYAGTVLIVFAATKNMSNRGFSLFNVGLYAVLIEFSYYWYHRTIHHKWFYKRIHHLHHTRKEITPLDSFHISLLDLLAYLLCLHLPVYLVKLTLCEYMTTIYFYITMAFVSHSEIAYNHHLLHHTYYKCNFCLVFPIFDVLFDTYKDTESPKSSDSVDK
jgi:sterol desaturase/sphingolipid hydroxylase (fatty acid hydroxylase superfamily)